jgi:hypothetical protein
MFRSSLLLTPTLALALVAIPATASAGTQGAAASVKAGNGKAHAVSHGAGHRIR